jgi:predicted dehydrogenase
MMIIMAEKPLKIGLIGAGANMKLRHIPGFRDLPGVTIDLVCNRSEESSQAVAEEYGIPRTAYTWRDVVEDPEIDAVCIGTWPYLHAEATIASLGRGKHVLCEARMAMNLEEAHKMMAALEQSDDRVGQLVPSPFTLDFDETIRHWLDEERLGRIYEVRVTHTAGNQADPDLPLNWRQHFEYSGINVLTLGIFHEAVQRWIDSDPVWLAADAHVFNDYRLDPETERPHHVRVPETVTVMGEYAGHGRLLYHFSGLESGAPVMEYRLNGSKGSLRLDLLEGRLLFAEAGETEETIITIPESKQRGWQVEADFIDSIRNGTPVRLTSFKEGLRYMDFTQRVFDAYTRGART